ncbi:MAG: hypothetical protein L3K19_09300 [Thermoplasmata archaeon]|nr:hypothetical protein [Thermoplasmata archaeon]
MRNGTGVRLSESSSNAVSSPALLPFIVTMTFEKHGQADARSSSLGTAGVSGWEW